MDVRRIKQATKYGWQHAGEISRLENVHKCQFSLFCDIMYCFFKYNLWSNQYKKEKVYSLDSESRNTVCEKYQKENNYRDNWVRNYFRDYEFLIKWGDIKYERSATLQAKRIAAYRKKYDMNDNCFVGYGVFFQKHHFVDSKITFGKKCHFAENITIDYTGGVTLEDNVVIAENVKILTHTHDGGDNNPLGKGVVKKALVIRDCASLGSRSYILPGVSEIGRHAEISAGSVVKRAVPPYAIVIGNPARVVGFKYPLQGIIEFEEENYPESQKIPVEVLEANYKKYFLDKIDSIKKFLE